MSRVLRPLGLAVGIACVAAGLLFLAQGTGVFPYPETSPMVRALPWAYRGVSMTILGVAAMVISRRLG